MRRLISSLIIFSAVCLFGHVNAEKLPKIKVDLAKPTVPVEKALGSLVSQPLPPPNQPSNAGLPPSPPPSNPGPPPPPPNLPSNAVFPLPSSPNSPVPPPPNPSRNQAPPPPNPSSNQAPPPPNPSNNQAPPPPNPSSNQAPPPPNPSSNQVPQPPPPTNQNNKPNEQSSSSHEGNTKSTEIANPQQQSINNNSGTVAPGSQQTPIAFTPAKQSSQTGPNSPNEDEEEESEESTEAPAKVTKSKPPPKVKSQKKATVPSYGKGKAGNGRDKTDSADISTENLVTASSAFTSQAIVSVTDPTISLSKIEPRKKSKATVPPKAQEEEEESEEEEEPEPDKKNTNLTIRPLGKSGGVTSGPVVSPAFTLAPLVSSTLSSLSSSSLKPKNVIDFLSVSPSTLQNGPLPPVLARKPNPKLPGQSKPKQTTSAPAVPSTVSQEAEDGEAEEEEADENVIIAAVDEEFANSLRNLTEMGIISSTDYTNKRISELFALLLENLLKSNANSSNEKDQRQLVHKAALEFTKIFKMKSVLNQQKNITELIRLVQEQILVTSTLDSQQASSEDGHPIAIVTPFSEQLTSQKSSKATTRIPQQPDGGYPNSAVGSIAPLQNLPGSLVSTALVPIGPEVDNSLQQLNVINLQALRILQNVNLLQNKSIIDYSLNSTNQDGFASAKPLELGGANNESKEIAEIESIEKSDNQQSNNTTVQIALIAASSNASEDGLIDEGNSTDAFWEGVSAAPEPVESASTSPITAPKPIKDNSAHRIVITPSGSSNEPILPLEVTSGTPTEAETFEPRSSNRSDQQSIIDNGQSRVTDSHAVSISSILVASAGDAFNVSGDQNTSWTIRGTTTESFWIANDTVNPETTQTRNVNETGGISESTVSQSAGSTTEEIASTSTGTSSAESKATGSKTNAVLPWSFRIVDPQTEWDSELANKESFQFKTLYGSLVSDLKTIFKKLEPERFVGVSIKKFSPGSVVVEGETELKERVEYGQLLENFQKTLQEQENKIGGRIIDPVSVVFDGRPNVGLAHASSGSSPNGTPAWVIGLSVACALLAAIIVSSVLIIARQVRRRRFELSPVDLQSVKLTSSLQPVRVNGNQKRGSSSIGTDNPFMSLHKNAHKDQKHSVRSSQADQGRRQRPVFDHRYYQAPYVTPGAYARSYLQPANYYSYQQQPSAGYGYW